MIEIDDSDPVLFLETVRRFVHVSGGLSKLRAKIQELTSAVEKNEGAAWIHERAANPKTANDLAHTILLAYVMAAAAYTWGELDKLS